MSDINSDSSSPGGPGSGGSDPESGRLWAPWRIDYILDSQKPEGCPFCFEGGPKPDEESLVLAVRPKSFVIMNRFPYTGCHLMVLPRRHVWSLQDLEDEEYSELMELVRQSVATLTEVVNPDGVNIGVNMGAAAGAGIEAHLHVHLVPRWSGDTNFMAVTAGSRVISQGLDHAFRSLRPAFAELDRA